MDFGLGTLLSGLVGGISNLFSQGSQIKVAREYNQAQRQLAEYQNEWNLEMWNKQNAYNSPVEQMKRYQQAGLNPHLIYGQGSNGNSQSSPKAAAYDITPIPRIDAGSAMTNAINSALQMAQIENVKANTEKVLSERVLNDEKALLVNLQGIFQEMVNEIKNSTKSREIDYILKKYDREFIQYDIDIFNRDVLQPLALETGRWNINKLKSAIALDNQKTYESMAQEDYIKDKNVREDQIMSADLEVKNAYIRNLDSQTRKANAEALKTEILTPLDKEIKKVESENAREVLQASLDKIASEVYNNYMNGKLRESDYYIDSYKRLLVVKGFNPESGEISSLAKELSKVLNDMLNGYHVIGPDTDYNLEKYANKYKVK